MPATGTAPVNFHPHHQPKTDSSYLTPADIAASLQVSTETVIRTFEGRPGVIDLGTPETMHKRRKRMLRIPRHAFQQFLAEKQVKKRRNER